MLTSAEQVKEVEVRGWDVADEAGAHVDRAGQDHDASSCRRQAGRPGQAPSATRRYVATDVPYRTQAEVDEAATALAEEIAGAFAEFEGVARGNPEVRAGAAITVDGPRRAVRRQVHRHHVAAPVRPDTGYTTSFSVTGEQDRSLLGLAAGGGPVRRPRPGVVIAQVTTCNDPEKIGPGRADVPLAVRRLRQRLGPDRAAGRRQGPRLDGRCPRSATRCWSASSRATSPARTCSAACTTASTPCPTGPSDLVDGGSGAVNRRSLVSRQGPPDRPARPGRQPEGVRLASDGRQAPGCTWTRPSTKITVHADGKVLIEGTRASWSTRKLQAGAQGRAISIKATSGVTVDGGSGAVQVKSAASVSLEGISVSVKGQTAAELKGGAMTTISGAMVKIN